MDSTGRIWVFAWGGKNGFLKISVGGKLSWLNSSQLKNKRDFFSFTFGKPRKAWLDPLLKSYHQTIFFFNISIFLSDGFSICCQVFSKWEKPVPKKIIVLYFFIAWPQDVSISPGPSNLWKHMHWLSLLGSCATSGPPFVCKGWTPRLGSLTWNHTAEAVLVPAAAQELPALEKERFLRERM